MDFTAKRKIFAQLSLFLVLLLFTAPLMAQQANMSHNILEQQVTVDVSAETVFAARQQAFGEARQKAWQQLLADMVSSKAQQAQAAKLPAEQVEQFVSSISVVSEQTTDVRYKATFAVEFADGAVRQYLENNGYGYALPAPKRVLIPLFIDRNNNVLIWEGTNPWRQAWESYAGEIPLILPLGDGLDLMDVNTGGTTEPDIMTLAERYGADGAVFTTVREDQDAQFVSVQYKIYPTASATSTKGRFVADTLPQAVEVLIETLQAQQTVVATPSSDDAYVYDTGEVDEYGVIEAAEENAVDPLVADSNLATDTSGVMLPSQTLPAQPLPTYAPAKPAAEITTASSAAVVASAVSTPTTPMLPSQVEQQRPQYAGRQYNSVLADPNAAYVPPPRAVQQAPVKTQTAPKTTTVRSAPPSTMIPAAKPRYVPPAKTNNYAVIVELQPGDSWLQIQRRLRNLAPIRDLRPVYLGSERAQVMLSVAAGEQEFRQTLRAAGFKVSDDWVLRYGG